jgi:hypothetical protein
MTQTKQIEVPWDDDSRWTQFDFGWIRKDENTGQPPEGTEYLCNLPNGARFTDSNGQTYYKAHNGPTQSSCTITNGDPKRMFSQLDVLTIVRPTTAPKWAREDTHSPIHPDNNETGE